MNEYRTYMDNQTVNPVLHEKIMNRLAIGATRTGPGYKPYARFAAVLACAAIVLTCVLAIPRVHSSVAGDASAVLSTNSAPAALPTVTQSPAQPTTTSSALMPSLVFNEAKQVAAPMRKYDPGYFQEKLLTVELSALLKNAWPYVQQNYDDVTGSTGFTGKGVLNEISISGYVGSRDDGFSFSIHMGKQLLIDYIFPVEPKTTNIGGISVTAGFWADSRDVTNGRCYARFQLDDTQYYLEIPGVDDKAKRELTTLVACLIEGGAADLSKITYDFIPPWRDDKFTLSQAKADPDFGRYVPMSVPAGFVLESARRVLNQNTDALRMLYCKGLDDISWVISRKTAWDDRRMVDVSKPETYDYSLYPIPHGETVPDELYYQVCYPIFKAEELTLNVIKARMLRPLDEKDIRIDFGVLYGDVLVEVSTQNVQPETLFAMLQKLEG